MADRRGATRRERGKKNPMRLVGNGSELVDESYILFRKGERSKSGYMMHFVERSLTELPIYDIISLSTVRCYPVAESALDSLPMWARQELDRSGHLKCRAIYDKEVKEFRECYRGWVKEPMNLSDVLGEILHETEGDRLARFVYYFLHEYASDHYADPETIAEIRGIEPSSVIREVRKAKEELKEVDAVSC